MSEDQIREVVELHMRGYDAKMANIEHSVRSIDKKIDDLYSRWHRASAGAIALLVTVIMGLISFIAMTAG